MDKMQFMLDNFKRAYPHRASRLEKQWDEQQLGKDSIETRPLIDWSKPLAPASTARQIRGVEYVAKTYFQGKSVYVCRLTYGNYADNGYEYYVMYDKYGCTLGKNAGTANVKNKAEMVTRHYAISKKTGDVVATADTNYDAVNVACSKGYSYDQLTLTSHTFTR